jgi:hypothetical protein
LLNEDRGIDFTSRLVSFDPQEIKDSYQIQPFGLPSTNDNVVPMIQMDKDYYDLHIGMYCQEFGTDEAAIQLLAQLVNEHPDIYDLGLSWGGVNGITLQGIFPGRFTSTDVFWNQRYIQYWGNMGLESYRLH